MAFFAPSGCLRSLLFGVLEDTREAIKGGAREPIVLGKQAKCCQCGASSERAEMVEKFGDNVARDYWRTGNRKMR